MVPRIRVLVVDDSAYIRKVIGVMLQRSALIEVVGAARDGKAALEMVVELNPDVVTLDLFMEEMDGVEFIRQQMKRKPLPVVICSIASEAGEAAVAAMEAGAVEFVRKPTALSVDRVYDIEEDLIQKVIAASQASLDKLETRQPEHLYSSSLPRINEGNIDAVVIGVSTGGPQALRYLLPLLPGDFPVPIAIVLHMPPGYTGPLAEKLNELSKLEVLEASEGMEMLPGRVILAKAGFHLFLNRLNNHVLIHLDNTPTDTLHCPAVDVLFTSASEAYGDRLLGIVMTGMGNDGTAGSAWVKAKGGKVFTQDEATSVVYGMPRSVLEAGLSDREIPLNQMAETIVEAV